MRTALRSPARTPASSRKPFRAALVGLSLVLTSLGAVAAQPGESLWQRLQHSSWVQQGAPHPEHLIYVITDANCPFCHDLWLALQPYYARGVQVRYVMVGIIASDSPGKAAAILQAHSPSRALDQNEKQWARLPDDLGGGIPPQSPTPATVTALRTNEQLMQDLGARGTPALAYRSADHALHVVQSGLDPSRLAALLSDAAAD